MILSVAVAVLLLAAPFCAWRSSYGWPSEIRDRMLLAVATLSAAVMTLAVEPGLGLLFGLAVWHWRSRHQLAGVLVWGAACLLYSAIKLGPDTVLPAAVLAIVVGATVQALWGACQHARGVRLGRNFHVVRESTHGSMGNRVVLATLCALALPLAPLLVAPALLLGLALASSYVGVAAALVALLVTYPAWWPVAVVAALAALAWTIWYRGHPRDSWGARLAVWRLALTRLWAQPWSTRLVGFGHGSFRRRARWWVSRDLTPQHFRDAHNDVVQVTFEFGLLGLAAVLLWAASVARGAALGDPLTGALAAGIVSALGQFPSYLPQVSLAMLAIAALLARRTVGA